MALTVYPQEHSFINAHHVYSEYMSLPECMSTQRLRAWLHLHIDFLQTELVKKPPYCTPWESLTTLTAVFMRREGEGRIQSQEEQPCGDRSRNPRGSYKLCAEGHQQLPEAGRGRNWSFPEDSGGGKNLPATSLRTLSPQNFGRINFCCLKWPGLQLFVIATLGNGYNICAN